MAADAITINTTAYAIVSIVTGVGGWFLRDFFRGGKAPKQACANCHYHEDHEQRIRALEAHRARAEESLGDIRDDLREVKGLLNAVLLRLGGAKPTP